MTLQDRYRRLLALYPRDHRVAYEREMLGVLMQSARPGQRFPGPAEAADLLWAALRARFRSGRRAAGWQDASAVVALLTAVALAAVAGRRLLSGVIIAREYDDPMRAFGVDGLLLLDVLLRTTAWVAVVVAILAGARRTAAGLGVAALAVELGTLAAWLPSDSFRAFHQSWALVLATSCVAALFVAIPGRTAGAVLGRRGKLLIGAGVAVGALGSAGVLPGWLAGSAYSPAGPHLPVLALLPAAALVLAGMRSVRRRVRRRVVVLLAPALAVAVTQSLLWDVVELQLALRVTPALLTVLVTVLIAVPLATFFLGAGLLQRRESVAVSARVGTDK